MRQMEFIGNLLGKARKQEYGLTFFNLMYSIINETKPFLVLSSKESKWLQPLKKIK